ncbi:hypothetical protein TNCV_2109671 [Trichonephila clavipes]|nr:hypothetical protein TNCV_2109671 [Trichonephila clavipes]
MDSWPACHEVEPSTAEVPPCRGAMHVESTEAQPSSRWCGVDVNRGGYQLKYHPGLLNVVQNYENVIKSARVVK